MCVGVPMRVVSIDPGHAWCAGRGVNRRVNTLLLGDVAIDDYVLVFKDAAVERISAARAAEVDAALDLVDAALAGSADAHATPAFTLPSSLSAADLAALTGSTDTPLPKEPA